MCAVCWATRGADPSGFPGAWTTPDCCIAVPTELKAPTSSCLPEDSVIYLFKCINCPCQEQIVGYSCSKCEMF